MFARERTGFIIPINDVEPVELESKESEATLLVFLQTCEELVRRFPMNVETHLLKAEVFSQPADATLHESLALIESSDNSYLHVSVTWFTDGEYVDDGTILPDKPWFTLIIEEYDDEGLFVQQFQYTYEEKEGAVYRRDLGPEQFGRDGEEKDEFSMIENMKAEEELVLAKTSAKLEDREKALKDIVKRDKYFETSDLAKSVDIDIRLVPPREAFGLLMLLNDARPYEEPAA